MAGQVAFDIVFDKKTKVVEKAKVATGIGHSCQLAWNPTLEEVKEEEFMENISPEEKKSMSIWEDLLQQPSPAHVQSGPNFAKQLALEDKDGPPTLAPRSLALLDINVGDQKDFFGSPFSDELPDAVEKLPDAVEELPDVLEFPLGGLYQDSGEGKEEKENKTMLTETGEEQKLKAPEDLNVKQTVQASEDPVEGQPAAKKAKVTFANRTEPKTPENVWMWKAARAAFNELIKPKLVHPAKEEPTFFKFCQTEWLKSNDPLDEQKLQCEAFAMAKDWLKENEGAVPMKV